MRIWSFIYGNAYGSGVTIIGGTLHLRWWTGFGIWLVGLGLAGIITSWVRDEY